MNRSLADAMRDDQRRKEAAERREIIQQWPVEIPTGFAVADDIIAYIRQRWGHAITTEKLEMFASGQSGPRPVACDGYTCYAFDEVDLWVYRTLSGVPADWREVGEKLSTVPIRRVEVDDLRSLMKKSRLLE